MADRPSGVFDAARSLLQRTPAAVAGKLFENYLLPDQLERAWMEAVRDSTGGPVFSSFLAAMAVRCECADDDLARLPAKGPVVVVANHPFGLIEGPILGALAARVRPDFKFLANSFLAGVPTLRDYVIAVDPFGGAARENWRALRDAIAWLRRGGMLITFPSGEVSSLQLGKLHVADPAWNENVTRIIQITGASSLPVFFHGANGPGFQMAGLIHPGLRTALLPRELLNKRGRSIRVSIGHLIGPDRFAQLSGDHQATEYLWHRTHLLRARDIGKPWRMDFLSPRAPIASAVDPAAMRAEIESLPADRLLLESGPYAAYYASAPRSPIRCAKSDVCARSPSARRVKAPAARWISIASTPHYQPSVDLEHAIARSGGRVSHGGYGYRCAPAAIFTQHAVPLPRRPAGKISSGAGAGPFLCSPGISEKFRRAGASVEGNRPISSRGIRATACCSARSASAANITRHRAI